jgi:hypothetical protein
VLVKSACCRCIILNAATLASVLEMHAAAVKFSLEEQQAAFDTAVSTYHARNQVRGGPRGAVAVSSQVVLPRLH